MRKKGISGIMRVKNDAKFIERCVESCINALDELVIVYNDCSDDSSTIIEKMRERYPEKIKTSEYPYKVYGANLNEEEYNIAKNLKVHSPHLLCNYYNYALSFATYTHAIKIDADQIYSEELLKQWTEHCKTTNAKHMTAKILVGMAFQRYFSLYRWLSVRSRKRIHLMPSWLCRTVSDCYRKYALWLFKNDKACLSLSGLNIVETESQERYVSMGMTSSPVNILPPFNGEGDHVIFKISDSTRYQPFEMQHYNQQRSSSYSIIEEFVHPYRIVPVGFAWIHISAMRDNIVSAVNETMAEHPEKFIEINEFEKTSFKKISEIADKKMFSLFQRTLFSFIYPAFRTDIEQLKRIK